MYITSKGLSLSLSFEGNKTARAKGEPFVVTNGTSAAQSETRPGDKKKETTFFVPPKCNNITTDQFPLI
jgi:hypothetical protein